MSEPDLQKMLEQIDEDVQILTLVVGQLADGRDHYAYVSIPPSKYEAFKAAEAKGNYNIAEFGKILHHANGREPTAAVKKEMEEKYGADHCFEENLQAMEKRIAAALKSES
jgi:superoxide dismutase